MFFGIYIYIDTSVNVMFYCQWIGAPGSSTELKKTFLHWYAIQDGKAQ